MSRKLVNKTGHCYEYFDNIIKVNTFEQERSNSYGFLNIEKINLHTYDLKSDILLDDVFLDKEVSCTIYYNSKALSYVKDRLDELKSKK